MNELEDKIRSDLDIERANAKKDLYSNCCFACISYDGRCMQCKENCVGVTEDEE